MYWLQCTSWWSWFGIGGCSLSTFEASLSCLLYIGVGMYKYRKREEKFVGIENKKALGIWAGERGQLLMFKLRTGVYSLSTTVGSWKDSDLKPGGFELKSHLEALWLCYNGQAI